MRNKNSFVAFKNCMQRFEKSLISRVNRLLFRPNKKITRRKKSPRIRVIADLSASRIEEFRSFKVSPTSPIVQHFCGAVILHYYVPRNGRDECCKKQKQPLIKKLIFRYLIYKDVSMKYLYEQFLKNWHFLAYFGNHDFYQNYFLVVINDRFFFFYFPKNKTNPQEIVKFHKFSSEGNIFFLTKNITRNIILIHKVLTKKHLLFVFNRTDAIWNICHVFFQNGNFFIFGKTIFG